ncbi:hypothetical protein [Denitratimonas sp. CY0512]|uniref:hypothetical protein n=1 Tax=Denitratimonas sp. CY0512 TaxID=3131940 RepID=UPI0030B4CDBD
MTNSDASIADTDRKILRAARDANYPKQCIRRITKPGTRQRQYNANPCTSRLASCITLAIAMPHATPVADRGIPRNMHGHPANHTSSICYIKTIEFRAATSRLRESYAPASPWAR